MISQGMLNQLMERIATMDNTEDRRVGDRRTTSSTVPYRATYNNGEFEETFYALDDDHASAVAHESAARNRRCFDMVQRIKPGER